VGLGSEPALVVEAEPRGARDAQGLASELGALARRYPHTARIRKFLFRRRLPVDVRHNAKIHRLALARWASSARVFQAVDAAQP
jgi:hypothetical protein